MKRRVLAPNAIFSLALALSVTVSSALRAQVVEIESEVCGPPISSQDVTVLDFRKYEGTPQQVGERVVKEVGPVEIVGFKTVKPLGALGKAGRLAAKRGCDIAVVQEGVASGAIGFASPTTTPGGLNVPGTVSVVPITEVLVSYGRRVQEQVAEAEVEPDVPRFFRLISEVRDGMSEEDRLDLLERALQAFTDDYLPREESEKVLFLAMTLDRTTQRPTVVESRVALVGAPILDLPQDFVVRRLKEIAYEAEDCDFWGRNFGVDDLWYRDEVRDVHGNEFARATIKAKDCDRYP